MIGSTINIFAAPQNTITRFFEFNQPAIIVQADNTCRVEMDHTRPDDIPAKPAMPLYAVSIEIPAGQSVDSVTLNKSPTESILLTSPITHSQPLIRPGDQPRLVDPDPQIYRTDAAYPANHRLSWRTDPTSGKTLLSVIFTPLQYNPVQGKLFYYKNITLTVSLSQIQKAFVEPIQKFGIITSPLDPEEHCDYLIISTSNLIENAAAPWDFDALLAQREESGFIVKILPVEWIYDNYAGADHPEQIRHFLQDAHATWNLKYLLIAGTHAMIPARELYIKVDGIFQDYITDIPADHIYYGCMDGTYDGNNNGRYGEYNDGDDGGDVDLTAEILVGRFPVENKTELSHMIRKTLQYDNAAKEEFRNNGFISETLGFDNVPYGEPFMEEIRNGSTTYGHNTQGYTTSFYADDFITTNNLHDNSTYLFTKTEVLNYFTNRLHSINHLGHGSPFQCFKLNSLQEPDKSAIAALNNPFPYFVYSQACLSGAFDRENCFAENFVTVSNAAVAAVMNSRQGWISTSGIFGPSHLFHRHFWDSAFRGNATTFGEMNEAQRRANLGSVPSFNASLWRWVYYELNLFGDPAMPVMPSLLNIPPSFIHEPLQNTFNTASNYVISCEVNPIGIYDPDSPFAVWSSSSGDGAVTQQMTRTSGNCYQLEIPAQPLYSQIDYFIGASNRAGYASTEPATGTHTFYITDELTFLIAGSPSNIGTAKPNYGLYSSASGLVINASAVDLAYQTESTRYANKGFIGTGSAPTESTNQFASFQIDVNSILIWKWQKEYRTQINSSISVPAEVTYWFEDSSTFTPPAADLYVTDPMTNLYAFAEWQLDGTRSPTLPEKSIPQHPSISINSPHELTAVYIPVSRDSDGNGIEDWWEYQYFGSPGQDIFADHDEDGYDIYEEFQDRSDPLDPLSIPAAPAISPTPINSPSGHPGPFKINANITDTHAVTNAVVKWRINGDTWQITPLTLTSNNTYEAVIAHQTAPGDLISYAIEAEDPSGNFASTPTYNIFLSYPVADYSLLEDLLVVTKPETTVITNSSLIINRGNMPLNWSISFGLAETFSSGSMEDLIKWDTTSIEQPWTISTNRASSSPYSMHARIVSTRGAAHYASITLPSLLIGPNAELSFSYWMDGETYTQNPIRAFDGGIVEYSTDGGVTFQQLSAPYTHQIYGYNLSPWPEATPCFSGLSEDWQRVVIDLPAYHPDEIGFEGQSVIFRFVYGGDDNTDHEGWYVDDIRISPAEIPAGFNYTLPETDPYTTAPGGFSELMWRNLPGIMESRTELTTVFFDSNAPSDSTGSFLWQALLREEPQIKEFNVEQLTGGNGDVTLAVSTHENDDATINLQLEWSDDRGHNWHNAAITNITATPEHADLPDFAPDGCISNIPGVTNSVPITNNISAIWNSATPQTDIGWSSNVYMRLTASNPWFSSSETRIFPVDNLAPTFDPGSIIAAPEGEGGDYLVTENLISLDWPQAVDTPTNNIVTYSIFAGTNLLHSCTNPTLAVLAISNRLDTTTTITIIPSDPMKNQGNPIELTNLILDSKADYDEDGATTAEEESAGTDASDPQSIFIVTAFDSDTNSTFSISWSSVENRSYTVESTPSLTTPAWTPIPILQDIPGTGAVMTRKLQISGTKAFFRVQVE